MFSQLSRNSHLAVRACVLRRAEAIRQPTDRQTLIVVLARIRTANEAHVAQGASEARGARARSVQIERVLVARAAVQTRAVRAELGAVCAEGARVRGRALTVDALVVVRARGVVSAY
jgi:hypothetical protein